MELLANAQKMLRRMLIAQGVASHTTSVAGHAVHYYRVAGRRSASPVVLVHGLGGSANGFFRTFRRLADRFGSVFAVDLPGNGFSPLPGSGALGLTDQLGVLERFAEQVVGAPAYVVGNSLGGAMCLSLAATRPELVRALALVAPAGARVSPERWEALTRSLNVQTVGEARTLTRRLFHDTPWGLLLFASELRKMYGTEAVRKVFTDARAEQRMHLEPELLSAVSMPTLLLWGKSEKLLPYEGLEYFRAHLPPTAQIEEVDGFGHIPQMERPLQLVERLVRFADQTNL